MAKEAQGMQMATGTAIAAGNEMTKTKRTRTTKPVRVLVGFDLIDSNGQIVASNGYSLRPKTVTRDFYDFAVKVASGQPVDGLMALVEVPSIR